MFKYNKAYIAWLLVAIMFALSACTQETEESESGKIVVEEITAEATMATSSLQINEIMDSTESADQMTAATSTKVTPVAVTSSKERVLAAGEGSIAIYGKERRLDLKLGFNAEDAERFLSRIGIDESKEKQYYTAPQKKTELYTATYPGFALRTVLFDTNGEKEQGIAWIYVHSSDYQTATGVKPGDSLSGALLKYGGTPTRYAVKSDKRNLSDQALPEEGTVFEWQRGSYYFFLVGVADKVTGYGISLEPNGAQGEYRWKKDPNATILYENKIAGYAFEMPASWDGYYRLYETEDGGVTFYYAIDSLTEYGGEYSIDIFNVGVLRDEDAGFVDGRYELGMAHEKTYSCFVDHTDDAISALESERDREIASRIDRERYTELRGFHQIAIDANATPRQWKIAYGTETE